MNEHSIAIDFKIPVRYSVAGETDDEKTVETVFLLHGYAERKERMMRLLEPTLRAPGRRIIAINGPFPVPIMKEDGFKEAYAWYFYSFKDRVMLIGPEGNTDLFRVVAAREKADIRPARIVAFSQGGFIIPLLASVLPDVRQAIGIGTGFRQEFYPAEIPYRLDAIHGSDDTVVEASTSQPAYQVVRQRARAGEFVFTPGGHPIDENKIAALQRLLAASS